MDFGGPGPFPAGRRFSGSTVFPGYGSICSGTSDLDWMVSHKRSLYAGKFFLVATLYGSFLISVPQVTKGNQRESQAVCHDLVSCSTYGNDSGGCHASFKIGAGLPESSSGSRAVCGFGFNGGKGLF